jgi:predicted 3-demethylubiquinone-9 3-methyltransferase (glyoxalase superfamily)
MQKITPFLWFDNQAEEAAQHYVSIFPDSKVTDVVRMGGGADGAPGAVTIVNFQLAGQDFIALNGGPPFKFTEAISLFVNCETQAEVDELWAKLTADGEESQCGWLKDKYGLSWQIIPRALGEMLSDKDAEKANRAMQAMLQMRKIDIAAMRTAFEGR